MPSKCKEVVGHKTADFKNYLRGYFEFWHIELYLSTVDILKNGELSKNSLPWNLRSKERDVGE